MPVPGSPCSLLLSTSLGTNLGLDVLSLEAQPALAKETHPLVCTGKGSEWLQHACIAERFGDQNGIKLLFLSHFTETMCIVSFSWFFPPLAVLVARGWEPGKLLVLLGVCLLLRSPLAGAAPPGALPTDTLWEKATWPGQEKQVKKGHNRQRCACRAEPRAAAEEPPAARRPLFALPRPAEPACLPLPGKALNFYAGAFLCIDQSLSHISGWDPA